MTTLISHYRVLKKLGEGGMGEVYAAIDERLGRKVALKLLPPAAESSVEWRLRMLREAQAASTINHPGIVTLHDVGSHEGRLFLVMELVDGDSFAALALRGLKPPEAVALVEQAADALSVAHAAGILHRDIKSDNLMRTRDGRVKVLDFGLAKVLGEAGETSSPALIAMAHASPESSAPPTSDARTVRMVPPRDPDSGEVPSPQLTRAGTVLGTPSYMSPEQTRGETPTEASEVFSLGVVLYELLTATRPFSRGNVPDTLAAVRKAEHTPPSKRAPRRGITPALDGIVARALAKAPADRFPDMAAFAAALRAASLPVVVRRRRWPWVAAGLVVAGGGAAAWAVLPSAKDGPIAVGPVRRLTFDPGCEEFPSFTPDGRTLVFDQLIENDYELMAMDLELGTRRRLTRTVGWDYAAVLSPDGTQLAYTHQSDSNSVRVRALAGEPEPVLLGPADGYPAWSADGKVLFGRGDAIWRWDGSGEARSILKLPEDRRAIYLAPFPDGTVVAMLGTMEQEITPTFVTVRGDQATPLPIDDAAEFPIAVAPGGERLYHLRHTATGAELVRRPRGGGPAVVVEGGVAPVGGLAFSPDGKKLVFSDCRSSSYVARVTDTGKVVPLTRQAGWKDDYLVGLGSGQLVLQSDRSGTSQVWRMELATGAAESLTEPGTMRPAVSHDGKWLAWAQEVPAGIWVAPLGPPLGKARRITDRRGDSAPQFSHDGAEVVFVRLDEKERDRVYAVPLAPGLAAPRPITPPGSPIAAVVPSTPDVFYLLRGGGRVDLMRTDLAAATPETVLSLPDGVYRGLRPSADGQRLLLIREDQEILEIDRSSKPPLVRSRWRGGVESATAVDYAPDGDGLVATLSIWEGDLWLVEGQFSTRTVDGRFTLGPAIGAGAASEVYRARDEQTGEEVALKLASSTWPQAEVALRFEREAAALSLLASPHVVHLVAAGSDEDGTPYLAMELLDGRDLQEEVRREGGLVPLEVLAWFSQAAAAVDLAHGLGIVHRDLKPGNLFLQERVGARTLKVLDFGLVKDTSGDLWASADAFVGTPLYMAPEQVRGHATRVGASTDVWALGMVAVTLLTGETYWRGPTVGETIADIDGSPLYAPSTRWPFLPPAFDQWFARSCHRVTDKRFRSAAAQASGLAVALRGMVVREAPAKRREAMGVVSTMLGQRTSDLTALDSELATPQAARGYLVGRQVELRELEGKLGAPGAIVSVTGPGGCGKTRLALAAASSAVEKMDGGVWIVRLGGARELAAAIATAMGLAPDAARGDVERVAAALADRRSLIVIDGFEQVTDAAPTLLALRELAPQASWLVTSRLPLGVEGEIRIALEPLERPPPSVRISVNEASSYAAIQLFLVRAREGAPDFALTASNVEAVATICRLVDGLPLAIELAAARVKDHSVAEVAAGLAGSADLVAGPLGWSVGLLGEREQRLLARLALLPAGATFEGATEICRGVVTPEAIAAALGLLVDGSLLSWTSDQPPRLSMLATVRDFCRARGEDPDAWPAVLAHLERIVTQAGEGASGDMQDRWGSMLDAEWGNLRAALGRTETEDPAAMLRLAGGLAWFWSLRGHYREGLAWLERALAGAPSAPGADRERALHGAGELAFLICQYAEAEAWLLQAAALGEARGVAAAEQRLGSIARERGDYPTARQRHQRSLAAWRTIGDRREAARAESYLVFLDWLSGDGGDEASARAALTGEVFAELGDIEGQVWSRLHQGAIAAYAGDRPGARAHLRQAFADAVAARYQEGIAWSLNLLGIVSIAAREWVQARAQLRASLKVHRRLGDRWRCASVLEALAAVCVDTGDLVRGGELLAAALAVREAIGTPVPECERARYAVTAAKATPAAPRNLDAAVTLADED